MTVTVPADQVAAMRQWVDSDRISADLAIITRKFALLVLRALILTCSVDTGRARAGFLPLFTKYGVSAADVLNQPSPYQQIAEGRSLRERAGQSIAQGLEEGAVEVDEPMHLVVSNAVDYVEIINSGSKYQQGTGFIDRTWQQAADYLERLMSWYVEARLRSVGFRPSINPAEGPGDIPV